MIDDSFYSSSVWMRKRKAILVRDRFQCQICKRYGKLVDATTVHHIKHLDEYPEYALQDSNLMSVCTACHNNLHPEKANWKSGKMNKKGQRILVIGNQGSGKTTYVKNHLGDGICYDLDAIAASFRLKLPHEEYHPASRKIANELLFGFSNNAIDYSDTVYIIRTSPTQEEVNKIKPDKVVYLKRNFPIEERKDYNGITDYTHRLEEIVEYLRIRSIPIMIIEEDPPLLNE